jgi:REP element-mobilizing transposase RayT
MANTYTRIYIQIVFAVKYRQGLIQKSWRDELHKYICGIINGKTQKVYAIGGVEDHIHILVSLKPDISISELVRDIKACSSKWVNERKLTKVTFQWQNGFGAFSYSQDALNNVIAYINKQEEHHRKKRFRDEYIEFMNQYQIDYDDRYLFAWIDYDGAPTELK